MMINVIPMTPVISRRYSPGIDNDLFLASIFVLNIVSLIIFLYNYYCYSNKYKRKEDGTPSFFQYVFNGKFGRALVTCTTIGVTIFFDVVLFIHIWLQVFKIVILYES